MTSKLPTNPSTFSTSLYVMSVMLGCEATSTMRGVRMHCEQSSVGNVSERRAMWPPMDDSRSTRMTLRPPLAMSRAVCMPAMPPPTTSAVGSTGTRIGCRLRLRLTFSTMTRTRSMALAVAAGRSACTHEQCSRRLAISSRYGLRPASAAAPRNVGSCIRGLHAPTTTPVSLWSWMAWRIICWPGSEHMYLCSWARATPGMRAAAATTAATSTVRAMFSPQWQTNTPMRAISLAPKMPPSQDLPAGRQVGG